PDAQPLDERTPEFALSPEVQPAERRNFLQDSQSGVGRYSHFQDDAVPPPVFWDVGDAQIHGTGRRHDDDGLAAQADFTGVRGSEPEQNLSQFRPPRSDQTGQSHDLAGPHTKTHVPDARGATADAA